LDRITSKLGIFDVGDCTSSTVNRTRRHAESLASPSVVGPPDLSCGRLRGPHSHPDCGPHHGCVGVGADML